MKRRVKNDPDWMSKIVMRPIADVYLECTDQGEVLSRVVADPSLHGTIKAELERRQKAWGK